jgi:1,4-alpha-glucan branching enzyme
LDFDPSGFEWIDCSDTQQSILSLIRKDNTRGLFAVVCNFTPVPRHDYRIGLPAEGHWKELLNSDAADYGGSGLGNMGRIEAGPLAAHGRSYSAALNLPPLACLFLKREGE